MQQIIEAAWENRQLLKDENTAKTIEEVVRLVDSGELRVAEKGHDGKWTTNDWVKKAIIMYFPLRKMEISESGIFQYHDKMMLKRDFDKAGVRVVPPATVRYGAFIAAGAILMPSYVNIGAYVDSGTMVDTWATVGSCAQIGKDVHLSGGVGIGGVLEPAQASPVIIEDGAFIGSRCIVVEGAFISKRAVLGAGVTITGSSKIIDVTGPEPVIYKGFVPEDAVVIPGTTTKSFPSGDYQVPCALIIGKRKASTDLKTSLNEALRDNDLVV